MLQQGSWLPARANLEDVHNPECDHVHDGQVHAEDYARWDHLSGSATIYCNIPTREGKCSPPSEYAYAGDAAFRRSLLNIGMPTQPVSSALYGIQSVPPRNTV